MNSVITYLLEKGAVPNYGLTLKHLLIEKGGYKVGVQGPEPSVLCTYTGRGATPREAIEDALKDVEFPAEVQEEDKERRLLCLLREFNGALCTCYEHPDDGCRACSIGTSIDSLLEQMGYTHP